MLSIGALGSASDAAAYYAGPGTYYTNGESQSQWGGGAREAAGLPASGPVDPKQFENLLNGRSADGKPLTAYNARNTDNRDTGWDLTFSVSKGISILAQGKHGEQIRKFAIMNANAKAMSFVESYLAQTRIRDPKTGKIIYTNDQKLIYASFMEETSRANDPDTHVHNAVMNLALGEDGKFRALYNRQIVKNIKLAGAVFRAEIAKGMRDLGVNLESAGKDGLFDVTNVSPGAKAIFSKRRQQMEAMRKDSTVSEGAMSRIVLISRPAKDNLSPVELLVKWDEELAAIGTSFEQITQEAFDVTPQAVLTPDRVLDGAISDLTETQRSFTKLDVLRSALMKDVLQATASELLSEMDSRVKSGALVQEGKHFTTPKILRREAAVIKQMEAGRLQGMVIAKSVPVSSDPNALALTTGQQGAADLIVKARDKIIGIQGDAGVGKTTLLKAAIPIAKEAGLEVIGIAPSQAAVDELSKTGMFDTVMTTQRFCLTPRGDDRTLLIVDESSMLGTQSMLNVLKYANDKDFAKVVLMGDVNQLGAVEAGTPFADMQRARLRTAKVNQIVRQKNPRHRDGISQLARGNIREGFKQLAPEIHETKAGNLKSHAVNLWQGKNDPKVPIIVQTNKQKASINAAIKDSAGHITPGLKHAIWRKVNATQREKALAKTYKNATHVRFNRDVKRSGIKRGDRYKIVSVDEARSTVTLANGRKTKTFRPAKYALGKSTVELYKQDKITLHETDRIRFTRGGRDRSVNNNDLGTVKAITAQSIMLQLDGGKAVTLPLSAPELRHMDHGWANTGHAFQGKTVKDAIVVMPSHAAPLTTIASLYTGISRHKDSVALITDNASLLKTNLEDALGVKTEQMNVLRAPMPGAETTPDKPAGQDRAMTVHDAPDDRHWLLKGLESAKPKPADIVRTRSNDQGR